MNTTLRKKTTLLIGAFVFALAACTTGTPPTTTDQGGETASISGTVSKDDGPGKNATIALVKPDGNDQDVVSTNNDGLYKFFKVPAGNYRVAFVIQSVTDRKNKTPQAFDPAFKTSEYFGAITTTNFDYDGNTAKTYTIPAFNVGWKSGIDAAVSAGKISFSWNSAKSATGYNVLVKDINDIPFFKTATLTDTKYDWTDLKGTEGNNKGKAIESGKTYYFIINALFDSSGEGPRISYGNTTNGSFKAP